MKAVQLLYSYLLVEKPFMLESQPSAPTKEKRFAYSLYLDLIYLMDQLSHQVVGKNKKLPLTQSRFILKIENDERLKSLMVKYSGDTHPFVTVVPLLKTEIQESLLFREFEKNRTEGLPTENFWENVFKAIILPNSRVNEIIEKLPGFSLSGVDRMKDMMSETFQNFYATRDNIDDALKTLETSLWKARDLYMRLLALPVELTKLRLEQITYNRNKYLATVADLNPNMRMVNNQIPEIIDNNKDFLDYIEKYHLSWKNEDPELLDILLKAIINSETYKKYTETAENTLKVDSEFWIDIFNYVILENQEFLEYLENKSVFWNDDLEIMESFVINTLKKCSNPETSENAVLPMYKDGDTGKDAKFGAELFNYVVRNKDLYKHYIQEVLTEDKWAADRLAFMDVVITMTALAEILNYPEIPLQVSINEYIEIAKSYSSAKSGQFINGLLASILEKLRAEGLTIKGDN